MNLPRLLALALTCSLLAPLAGRGAAATPAAAVNWDSVPAILARIKAPSFPARDFPVTDYGAKADGTTDSTDAIRQAIAACAAAGGGRVVVTGGVFLTGAVHLKSNVNLHIAEGATLKFSADPEKFLPVVRARFEGTECMNFSPLVYAFQQENIAVTGKGTLDGSASATVWWPMKGQQNTPPAGKLGTRDLVAMGENNTPVEQRVFGAKGVLRPNFIVPYSCKNILIEDVTILASPMWEINPVLCSNVTVRGVKISTHGPNNDGCNPDSSRDVLIEQCVFDTGDDCIAIKSGRDADGRRVNVVTENIVIRNCEMKDGHGGVVLGSENAGGIRNVFAENCKMDSPNLERALRLKTNALRGGFHENVFFRNIEIGRVSHSILTIDLVYERVTSGPYAPNVRNILMENVTATSAPRVLSVVGTAQSRIENVRIENSKFTGVEGADILANCGTVEYRNVSIEPAKPKPGMAAPPRSPNGN